MVYIFYFKILLTNLIVRDMSSDMVYGPDDMKRRFKLFADGKPLPYERSM